MSSIKVGKPVLCGSLEGGTLGTANEVCSDTKQIPIFPVVSPEAIGEQPLIDCSGTRNDWLV